MTPTLTSVVNMISGRTGRSMFWTNFWLFSIYFWPVSVCRSLRMLSKVPTLFFFIHKLPACCAPVYELSHNIISGGGQGHDVTDAHINIMEKRHRFTHVPSGCVCMCGKCIPSPSPQPLSACFSAAQAEQIK